MSYWRGAVEDEAMQDEHGFIWRAILDTIDVSLTAKRVLDIGCNRGGFLRLLADECGIAEGLGYDPALGAIEDARRLCSTRPLRFDAAEAIPPDWSGLDVAFSHEVLYLLNDLSSHAADAYRVLAPGGVYYAVTGVHAGSPLMAEWHRENASELGLPALRDLDDMIAVFKSQGFEVSVARLSMRFVPTTGHGHHDRRDMLAWLDYYCEQKVLLRFGR